MVLPARDSDLNPYDPPASEHVERTRAMWSDTNLLQLVLGLQLCCMMVSLVLFTGRQDYSWFRQAYPLGMLVIRTFALSCFAGVALVSLCVYRWPLWQRAYLVAMSGALLALQLTVTDCEPA